MSRRIEDQIVKSREQALAAFIAEKAEIDTMLTRLQELSEDHFGYTPDEISWGRLAPWSTTLNCSSALRTVRSRMASTPCNLATRRSRAA